jgi:NitT/TauT family transport system substrate-binding protein
VLLTRRALIAGVAGAGVAACSRSEKPPARRTMDKVTVMTGFNITGQDSFLFAALEKGWYRNAGIEVTVQAGAGTGRNLQALAAGNAQFAVIDLTGGLLEIDKGAHIDFRVFAAIYQLNVSCIVALPRAGIRTAQDLAGKSIGYTEGGVNKTIFPAYAQLAGLDHNLVRWQPLEPPLIRPALLAGRLDAATEIVIGRPALEAAAKQQVTMLPYSDQIRDLYGNAFAVSTDLARSNPGLVRRFRDATFRGIQWTIENPTDAGRVMAKHNPTYKAETAEAEIRQTVQYVRGAAPVLGHLDEARLARSIALVQGIGLVKSGLTVDKVAALDLAPQA